MTAGVAVDALRAALVASVLTLVLATTLAAADRDKPLAVGDTAPALELGDQHGTPFRLAEALGAHRYLVVAFYPKAFTGG